MSTVWIRDEATGNLVREEKRTRKKALVLEEEPTRIIDGSMSKSELVLNCQWWMRRPVPLASQDEPAAYGSAFHDLIATRLAKGPFSPSRTAEKWSTKDFDIDAKELKRHSRRAHEYLTEWLRGANVWKVDFLKRAQTHVEQAFAWNVMKKKARDAKPPTVDGHVYKNVKPDEFPGTADLIVDSIVTKKDAPDLIVIDHKTGENCDLPKHSAQLRSLMLVAAKRAGAKRVVGGILHAPREGDPHLYVDEFTRGELTDHANALRRAWRGIGTGSLRPGPWCYKAGAACPAFTICPVYTSAIEKFDIRGTAMTEERIGAAHETLARFEAWSKQYKDTIIRPWVRKHGPAPRPDGKLVQIRLKSARGISMASIIRTLGPIKGAKRIAELDQEGLITISDREELIAVADK